MTEINKINGNGLKNSGKISSNPKPEKGKEPNVNSIMVGGIKYNKNDVIQTRISQISLPDALDGSIFKDAARYEVTLKMEQRLCTPRQIPMKCLQKNKT